MKTWAEQHHDNMVQEAEEQARIDKARIDKLEETWFAVDSDNPELMWKERDILAINIELNEKATRDSKMRLNPFVTRGGKLAMFIARYELIKFGGEFTHPEGVVEGTAKGFTEFLAGFPLDCTEMLVVIGLESSKDYDVQLGVKKAAPVPDQLFFWGEPGRVLLNKTAKIAPETRRLIKDGGYAKMVAAGVDPAVAKAAVQKKTDGKRPLEGEPVPTRAHWWIRASYMGGGTEYPEFTTDELGSDTAPTPGGPKGIVPGEFVALGVRLMPDVPWGTQVSSPFLYSGAWVDTVYLTGGRIIAVNPPTALEPYPTYTVFWRPTDIYPDGFVTKARPSDFAEYKVKDRVTTLKDVATEKKSQQWDDDDTKDYGGKGSTPATCVWQIVPIGFYGLDKPKEA